jgi:hypothetical protein
MGGPFQIVGISLDVIGSSFHSICIVLPSVGGPIYGAAVGRRISATVAVAIGVQSNKTWQIGGAVSRYHKTTDTVAYMNYDQGLDILRGIAGTLCRRAGLA